MEQSESNFILKNQKIQSYCWNIFL